MLGENTIGTETKQLFTECCVFTCKQFLKFHNTSIQLRFKVFKEMELYGSRSSLPTETVAGTNMGVYSVKDD